MKKKYALIGHPLGHSLSPQIHERLFVYAGISDFTYELMDLDLRQLKERMPELLSLSGFNITIPYKTEIIKYLDGLDGSAARYSSVNTVKCGEKSIGYNTDADGFIYSIKNRDMELNGKILILGCGGVGRMMAIEAAYSGAYVTLAVRESDMDTAKILANELSEIYKNGTKTGICPEITDINRINGAYDLLINSTPVGMYPHIDECPVNKNVVSCCKSVFDAIYNPCKTKLVRTAENMGIPAESGMSMLVRQAAAAHTIWNGSSYSNEDIQKIIDEL